MEGMARGNSGGDRSGDGLSRRRFLKRVGAAAIWTVPTMQVVNMAAATAGEGGGVISSVVPTTTRPPDPCDRFTILRFKANAVPEDDTVWVWSQSVDTGDCVASGFDVALVPSQGQPIWVSGEADGLVTAGHDFPNCEIVAGYFSDGANCVPGSVASDGSAVVFDPSKGQGLISHVEILVECCSPVVDR